MKKILDYIIEVLLYVWQLPQNIVGLFLLMIYLGSKKINVAGIDVFYNTKFPGGISLGRTIIVGTSGYNTVKHEHGHQIQSLYLGPLYLFVIGIPSICWAGLYGTKLFPRKRNGYYVFYTESWADKLGGVVRA